MVKNLPASDFFFCKNRIYSACKCAKNIVQWQILYQNLCLSLY